MLVEAGPKGLHVDRMWVLLYGHKPECEQPDSRIIPVLVCNLRKKIAVQGIRIEPIRNFGYRLTEVIHEVH